MTKIYVILIFGLFFTEILQAQNQESYLICKLVNGCPNELRPIMKQYGLSNLSYSNLETGIDTIKVVFGRSTKGELNGYWIFSYVNNRLLTFSTVKLLKVELSQSLTNIVDISYDNSAKKISVQLTHNTSTNEIQYFWFDDNNQKSKIASIINIKKPIQKDKLFPPMKVVSLKGDSISIKDFMGKFIVINWWATDCAP